MKRAQEMVKGIVWISEECDNITLDKAIDEYNYMCALNEKERSKKTQKKQKFKEFLKFRLKLKRTHPFWPSEVLS